MESKKKKFDVGQAEEGPELGFKREEDWHVGNFDEREKQQIIL